MPASTEGTDLKSWFANREEFRRQVRETVERLNGCQRRLLAAAAKRPPDGSVSFTDETVSGIEKLTEEAVNALQQINAELSGIASARTAAKNAQMSLNSEAERATKQLMQKEAERVAQNTYAARKRQAWMKGKAFKLAAAGVLLVTFVVLYKF